MANEQTDLITRGRLIASGALVLAEPTGLEALAGGGALKAWAKMNQTQAFAGAGHSLLIAGAPGCGRSLAARAVACAWGLPLLRFAPERGAQGGPLPLAAGLAQALETLETFAPAALWLDQPSWLRDAEQGHPLRVLDTWLKERKATVNVIVTTSDPLALPEMLLRRDRLCTVFFMDLPDHAARVEIVGAALPHDQRPAPQALEAIGRGSEGYSGAELRVACQLARRATRQGLQIEAEVFLQALRSAQPLSRRRAAHLESLRAWARVHASPAHG